MTERPNLILFMPETLRADAVFGDPEHRAQTPNFDRLAAESVVFTNAFAQMAFCTPSRCSMFTGLYPHTNGHRSIWHLLQKHERNFFQDLKEAGYVTVAYGKNDLVDKSAADQCFDETTLRIEPKDWGRTTPPEPGSKFEHAMYHGLRTGDCFDYDWACIESALQFMEEKHDRPWCLFLPLIFVHPTYVVEEPFFSMHDRSKVPASIPAELDSKRSFMRVLHEVYGGDRLDDDALREIKATYFGMVSRVDHQLGQVLDRLKELGLEHDTIVVASSDHGDYTGDYGMVEKFFGGFEDCLLRVPLIVRASGQIAPGTQTALCEMTDLYPTLLELLGLDSKHYHFGRSLVPLIQGKKNGHRDAVFAEAGRLENEESFTIKGLPPESFYGRMVAATRSNPHIRRRAATVRTRSYKYTYSPEDRDELCDLNADPAELNNLADRPEYRETVLRMRERLMRWMLDTSDTLPLQQGERGWR